MIDDSLPLHHMSEIHKLHTDPRGFPSLLPRGCNSRILLIHQQDRCGVEVEQSLLLEPRLELHQLREDAVRPAVDGGREGAIGLLIGRGRIGRNELPQDPAHVLDHVPPHRGPGGAPERVGARRILDLDARHAKAEGDAGALAVLDDALLEVVFGAVGGPRAAADLEIDERGRAEAGEEVVEGEMGARAGGIRGREDEGAVEAREEGEDMGRDGRVREQGGVEGDLGVAPAVALEWLVKDAAAIDQRTQLPVLGPVARHLVLRRLQHRAGSGTARRSQCVSMDKTPTTIKLSCVHEKLFVSFWTNISSVKRLLSNPSCFIYFFILSQYKMHKENTLG